MTKTRILLTVILTLLAATAGYAQDDDDRVLKPAEPDFTLISLPTSLRLPRNKSAFRVTHRFTRPLSCDTCPNSVWADGFGIDSGAQIGLEFRFGIAPNTEIGVNRTSDKTIELFGQYALVRQGQGKGSPFEASALLAIDFTDVGRQQVDSQSAPALGLILTRLIGEKAALYVEPIWVHNTNLFNSANSDNSTFVIGLGARVRVLDTVYVVGEFVPRVSGYKPGVSHGSFGIEKRAGGHMFQLNFSDSFATALGQIARGGTESGVLGGDTHTDWFLGFNITRKFY